jgi:hypothetical protein
MSRNSSGTYSLPAGNPVVTGTTITATWGNTTMSDIATALTDSLSRSGNGAMLAPLKNTDGTVLLPSVTFSNETSTGFYRAAAGQIGATILGVQKWLLSATQLTLGVQLVGSGGAAPTGTWDLTGATVTVPTQAPTDDSTKVASTAFVQDVAFSSALPDQTGNAGKFVTTDGTNASWTTIDLDSADVTGTLPLTKGGTGATTAANARANLDLSFAPSMTNSATTAGTSSAYTLTPSPAVLAYTAGQVFLIRAHTASAAGATLNISGLGALALKRQTNMGTLADIVAGDMMTDGSYLVAVSAGGTSLILLNPSVVLVGAATQSLSGVASVEWTGLPAWATEYTLLIRGASPNGGAIMRVELGDSGGYETTGYTGRASEFSGTAIFTAALGNNFELGNLVAADTLTGTYRLYRPEMTSELWQLDGSSLDQANGSHFITQGYKTTSAAMDRIRLAVSAGTFDAGSATLIYR